MSQFKIALCIPFINNYGDVDYKRDYFTNYINEKDTHIINNNDEESFGKNSTSFSYEEKITIGKNAQVSLEFKMNKYYQEGSEILINPFVPRLLNGSIIELTDKDGILYRFAIKNIQYDMKPNNVVISYSAQDFFNYQNSRQNDGYEIVNDSESDHFIGALTIDEWATQHIIPDCKIAYNYIPLSDGIYMGQDGTTHHFVKHTWKDGNAEKSTYCVLSNDIYIKTNKYYYDKDNNLYWIQYDSSSNRITFRREPAEDGVKPGPQTDSSFLLGKEYYNSSVETDEKTLILPSELFDSVHKSYSDIENVKFFIKKPIENNKDNKDYYQSIIFSCSSSSAANALFSLGEQLGMMINVDYFHNWIWFTDIKNPTFTGLSYSPAVDLQTIGVDSNGESLATVINVNGPTIGDDLVTLIPTIPDFFRSYVQTDDWKNSSWHPGLFRELCTQHKAYVPGFNSNISPIVWNYLNDGSSLPEYIFPKEVTLKIGDKTYYFKDGNITINQPTSWSSELKKNVEKNIVYYYTDSTNNITFFYRLDDEFVWRKYVGYGIFAPTVFNHYDSISLEKSTVLKFINSKTNEEKTYSIANLDEDQIKNEIILSDLQFSLTKDTILPGKHYQTIEAEPITKFSDIEWKNNNHTILSSDQYYVKLQNTDATYYFNLASDIENARLEQWLRTQIANETGTTIYKIIKTDASFHRGETVIGNNFYLSTQESTDGTALAAQILLSIFIPIKDGLVLQKIKDVQDEVDNKYKNYYDLQSNLISYVGQTPVVPDSNIYYELSQTSTSNTTGYTFSTVGINPIILIDINYLQEGAIIDWKLDCTKSSIYLGFNREATEEELEFADIADSLPYLENKIIKVEYLKKVFSSEMYEELENIIYNKLRINNGLLLYYYIDYITSISLKTQRLAELVNACDLLGANIMTEITNDTSIKFELSKNSLTNSYWDIYKQQIYGLNLETEAQYNQIVNLFGLVYDTSTKEWIEPKNRFQIQGWEDLLTSYARKYNASSQSFMKNIYNFRKFWNARVDFIDTDGYEWTNGQYYFNKYKKDDNNQTVIENVALIETTLTGYWTAAYNASLNGHYFLPEKWQPNLTQEGTYTCSQVNIYDVINEKGEINSKWVPEITVKSNVNEIVYTYDNSIKIAEENKQDWMMELDCYNWKEVPVQNSLTNIYEVVKDTGKTWIDLLIEIKLGNLVTDTAVDIEKIKTITEEYKKQYKYFDGSYIIIFKILKDCMFNKNTTLYETYLNNNKKIWQQIHKDYGMLILESSFTSDNAVDSKSLLQQAMAYYKDYEKPQTKYSLSVIDIAHLDGYTTIPIAIGDQVALVARSFYDEEDYIKQLLEERLFVNEISYELRKDSDITLGVDTISYQDKLISKLVKLIK